MAPHTPQQQSTRRMKMGRTGRTKGSGGGGGESGGGDGGTGGSGGEAGWETWAKLWASDRIACTAVSMPPSGSGWPISLAAETICCTSVGSSGITPADPDDEASSASAPRGGAALVPPGPGCIFRMRIECSGPARAARFRPNRRLSGAAPPTQESAHRTRSDRHSSLKKNTVFYTLRRRTRQAHGASQ